MQFSMTLIIGVLIIYSEVDVIVPDSDKDNYDNALKINFLYLALHAITCIALILNSWI